MIRLGQALLSEGWLGAPFAHQPLRTREYIDVVGMILRGERLRYGGETFCLPLEGGEGKPLKLILRPPRSARAGSSSAGRSPTAGCRRTGRRVEDIAICPRVTFRVDDDPEPARALMRPALALYVGGMGSATCSFYNRLIAGYGFEDVAREVQELYLGGDQAEAAELFLDERVDRVCLYGPADRVADPPRRPTRVADPPRRLRARRCRHAHPRPGRHLPCGSRRAAAPPGQRP